MQRLRSTAKESIANLIKSSLFITLLIFIACIIYKQYFAATIDKVITIYPDSAATKIRPLHNTEKLLRQQDNLIYSSITPLALHSNNNTKIIDLLPEPEQPLNISSLFQRKQIYTDPIDAIIVDLIENTARSSTTSESSVLNNSLKITQVTGATNKFDKISQKTKTLSGIHKYSVQLASVKSEAEGNALWQMLQTHYPKLLAPLSITMQKITYDKNKFYYILLVHGYDSLNQAKNMCKQLAKFQQQCTVLRN